MIITVTIDDEIAKRVHIIAADKNTTLTAMVREYLASVAAAETSELDAAARQEAADKVRDIMASLVGRDAAPGTEAGREAAAKFLESVRQLSRPMGPRNWTRDELYDRPKAFFKRD